MASGFIASAIGMVGADAHAHGTDEQQERYLRPLLRGDEVWCQLFSEPGAGSDLAGLAHRAVRDGDEWVVNGQKVWTSGAHYCDWGILLARTDPDAPKHRGITLLPRRHDARPASTFARCARSTGVAHFNEVFLDGVRVPARTDRSARSTAAGAVARTTLANERATIGVGGGGRISDDLIALAATAASPTTRWFAPGDRAGCTSAAPPPVHGAAARTAMSQGRQPGAEASVLKLAFRAARGRAPATW